MEYPKYTILVIHTETKPHSYKSQSRKSTACIIHTDNSCSIVASIHTDNSCSIVASIHTDNSCSIVASSKVHSTSIYE